MSLARADESGVRGGMVSMGESAASTNHAATTSREIIIDG
jgi:hypothetical protein